MTILAYILAGRKMDGRLKRQLEFILETDAGDTCMKSESSPGSLSPSGPRARKRQDASSVYLS